MNSPNRKLQSVSNDQLLIKLSCGHKVYGNHDILDYIPSNQVPLVHCNQCDAELIQGLPAVDIRAHYSNVTGVQRLDPELRDVLSGVPFILFDSLVYVSPEQSRLPNGGR